MKVLVFGGTGRTGRLIIQRLLDEDHSVMAAGRRDPQVEGVALRAVDLDDTAVALPLNLRRGAFGYIFCP